ncbi:MAG TPA: ABC transporter substrate-binding protein [Azospirillum sp.]|nr:ABC transporter substrate-binding protein [Azospirillum sp.]
MRHTRISLATCCAIALAFSAAEASAQKIIYNLTSPTPTVAEAPHASVPAALGFWKESGLDVQVNPVNGSTLATQLVAAGTAQFAMPTVEPVIGARQQGGKIIAVYNHTREPIYTIAVPANSSITQLAQLKGKRIGVLSLSSGAVPFAKAMLAGAGLDPERDVSWLPIGIGSQAAQAVQNNQVDALGYWDWGYAVLENAGLSFRHFTTEETKDLLSLMIIGNEDFVKANPDVAMKLAQGIAKATLFTINNPEAAVRIHWEHYPQSKPTGVPEEVALKQAVHVLSARLEKYRIDRRAIPKWGAFTEAEWRESQDFLLKSGIASKSMDVKTYYTDQFIDKINDFDQAAIVAKAKAYK